MNGQAPSGKSFPLGATLQTSGANFCVYSKEAYWVKLLFYAHVDDSAPKKVFRLDPATHRTAHYWHAFIDGVQPGQLYGYRVHGPFDSSLADQQLEAFAYVPRGHSCYFFRKNKS